MPSLPNLTNFRLDKVTRLAAIGWLVLLLSVILSLGFFIGKPTIDTNLLAILPKQEDKVLAPIIDKLSEQVNNKLLLVATFAKDSQPQALLNEVYHDFITNNELFSATTLAYSSKQMAELYDYLLPYRQQLLTAADSKRLQTDDFQGVIEQAQYELYGFGKVDEAGFYQDPLRLYQHYFTSLVQVNQATQIELSGDWLKSSDTEFTHYFLILELTASPYEVSYQNTVKSRLSAIEQSIEKAGGQFAASGAILFAEHGYSQSKSEISTVGAGGLMGILLLFIYTFRSFKPLLWMLVLMTTSLLFALTVTLWLFGKVHIFSLLMATPLIGISIDYGFHFFTDFYFSANNSRQTIKHIIKGLSFGLISSVLAYTAFFLGQVEVLQQVALITTIGLLSMYLSVVLLLPPLLKADKAKTPPVLFAKSAQILLKNPLINGFRNPLYTLVCTCLLLVLTLVFVSVNDDVRSYQTPPQELVAVEKTLKKITHINAQSNYLILLGNNLDSLFADEKRIYQNHADSLIAPPLYSLLIDAAKQQQNYQLYQRLYQSSAVEDFISELTGGRRIQVDTFASLDLNKLVKQPAIQTLFTNRLLQLESGYALLIAVTDNQSLTMNNLLEADIVSNKIYSYNQATEISARFADLRNNVLWLLVVVVILLLLVCGYRYRRLEALNIALIPVVAGLVSLLLTYLMIDSINIFNILALLLLLGMGLDYVIFLRESETSVTVMVSLLLSCITTLLSFGLLAFSQTAAVASFGLMVSMGIVLVLLLSPAVVRKEND